MAEIRKSFTCVLDSEQKTISTGTSTITLINGKKYKESHITDSFPNLFELIEDLADDGVINGSNKVKEKEIVEKAVKVEESNLNNVLINLPKEKEKNKFSWSRLLLLFIATSTIAGISAYLRVHGISIIFKIDIIFSLVLVAGFIISEFAIASLLLREIKSKFHAALNFTVLGMIQVALIGMSFVFEFTTLSDWILVHKNKANIVVKQELMVNDTLKDYDARIKSIQDQINITPDSYITKRSKLTSELNTIIEGKNKEKVKIESMLSNTESTNSLTESQGMESAAKILAVKDEDLTKGVLVVIAGILNILYLFFIYGFITEWKRRGN